MPCTESRNQLIPGARSVVSMLLTLASMISEWWAETDSAILQCLRERGAMSPADLARSVGISPGESNALVCMLAAEGKVKVRLVALEEEDLVLPVPAPSRGSDRRQRRRSPATVGAGKR